MTRSRARPQVSGHKTLLETLIEVTRETAKQTAELIAQADATADTSERVGEASGQMAEALDDIAQASEKTAGILRALQGIADQTHIVAVNAAIVAAGAGEAGKPFQVVAEQVRGLASESMGFARQSEELLVANLSHARRGVETAQRVSGAISQVHGQISEITESIRGLSAAQKDQIASLQQMRALAVTINVAGAQRMLSQRMTKEFLLIVLGHDVEHNRAVLRDTCNTFHNTLRGLLRGNAEQGLIPPATDQIREQLETVGTIWMGVWSIARLALRDDAVIGSEEIDILATKNIELLKAMNEAVMLYQQLA